MARRLLLASAVVVAAAGAATLAGADRAAIDEARPTTGAEDAPASAVRDELSDAEWARLGAGEPLHALERFADRVVVVLCFQHW